MRAITNWAGNYTYRAANLLERATVEELQQLLPTLAQVKALGARHSFNSIADTEGTQISLARFKSMSLDSADAEHPTVTIGAGVTYGELAPLLHRNGYALPNLASLPHISVAGACATATHGSGVANQCLSTAVNSVEIVTASGEFVQMSRDTTPEIFPGCVVSVGALGIATRVTLDLVPTFEIAQTVYENLSFDQLEHNLLPIFAAGYSVSLFTDWQQHRATQVWVKRTIDSAAEEPLEEVFFGATRQKASLHPIAGVSAENCTEQFGVAGPWHERLPHFRMEYTPSAGAELQTEYFVPLAHAADAIRAVEELRDRITPLLFVSEFRTIAADDLWLSMAYARDSLAIHFTWHPQPEAVFAVLPLIESQLAPFAARPHWGKLFTPAAAQVHPLYPRMKAFRELAAQLDPRGTLRNGFLAECLGI